MDWSQLRAADLMQRETQWAEPETTLRAATESMHEAGTNFLLIKANEAGGLPGIVTSKDVVNLVGNHGPEVLDRITVGEAMSRPAVCVPVETGIADCIQMMRLTGVRRLPVLQGLQVVGVLCSADVFQHLAQPAAHPA